MIILFVSHLSTNIAAGLNWSVPMSVKAQQAYDEVLWVNTTNVEMPHWKEVKAFHHLAEYGERLTLQLLPEPFLHPDLVVFEGLYFREYVSFSKELKQASIPYIIVPRSSLTYQALHNHARIKKWFAHKLLFDRFIKNAWNIQYLTQKEADDSTRQFRTSYYILPNGVNLPKLTKTSFSRDRIHAVFIGRLDMYQKGLDLLLHAVAQCQDQLRKAHFSLSIYGPQRYDHVIIKQWINDHGIADIVQANDEITGEEKKKVLLQSDFFVLTSRFEGHPMGLLEALSYGLPCMVTPGSNMYDEVRDHKAGWTCEENIESMVNTLLDIISHTASFSEKGAHARELSKAYNWDTIAQRFHTEVLSVLQK